MRRLLMTAVLALLAVGSAGRAVAQESKAAATTRKNLQQKVTLSAKEIGLKNFLEGDLNGELDKPLRFKIDNGSGVSNNMKVSFAGKNVTVEKVLNELSDKYGFGYYVISNAANNREDGKIVIRKNDKGKERGYEAGKEPRKGASVDRNAPWRPGVPRLDRPARRLLGGDACRAAEPWHTSLVRGAPCCYRPKERIVLA